MRTVILALLAIILAPALHAQSILFTWQNGDPTVPVCSASVTKSCISGYTLSDTTSGTVVLSSTIAATATSYTYPLPPLTAAGTRGYSLVANGKDENGAVVASGPATTTVAVPAIGLAPPSGFGAVVNASAEMNPGPLSGHFGK